MTKNSFCAYAAKYNAPAQTISYEQFKQTENSPEVKAIIYKLRDMITQNIRAEDEGKTKTFSDNAIRAQKAKLPIYYISCRRFEGNQKTNEAARDLTNVMMLDFDHLGNNAQEVRDKFAHCGITTDQLREQGFLRLQASCSGGGSHGWVRKKPGETNVQCMDRISSFLQPFGIDPDPACKNLSRGSFVSLEEDIIFLDEDALFAQEDVVENEEEAIKKELNPTHTPKKSAVNDQNDQHRAFASDKQYPAEYDGVPYLKIQQALEDQRGGTPQEGQRHTMYLYLANKFKHLCDYNPAWMYRAIDVKHWPEEWQGTEKERESICIAACCKYQSQTLPIDLQRAIIQAKQDMADAEEIDYKSSQWSVDALRTPHGIPAFELVLRKVPEQFHPLVLFTLISCWGAAASSIRLKYYDNETHSFSFIVVAKGDPASGKSFATRTARLVLAPLAAADDAAWEKVKKYEDDYRASKNAEKQPVDPKAEIRIVGPSTVPGLLKAMANANGKHLICVTDELSAMLKNFDTDYSAILRCSFDNSYLTKIAAGAESVKGKFQIFYNCVWLAQPDVFKTAFKSVQDGTVERVIPVVMPDTFAAEQPRTVPYTELEKEKITNITKRLMTLEGEIHCQAIDDAFIPWEKEKINLALRTQSAAVDTFRRRAKVIGWRAAYLAYVLTQGTRIKQCIEFGLWVAEYVFRAQMQEWGERYDWEKHKAENGGIPVGCASATDIFNLLPETFTTADLIALRAKNKMNTSNPTMIIKRWFGKNFIIKLEKNKYKKIV